MNVAKILTPAAVLAALVFAAPPVHAAQHGGSHSRGSGGGGHATSRGSGGAAVPRGAGPSRAVPAAPRVVVQSPGVYAVQRGGVVRGGAPRGGVFAPYRYYRPSYYRPSYYRPYYAFRPRFSLGFGLWVGYPIPYPYYYGYGYPYPYPYSYPYPYPYAYGSYYPAPSYGYPAYGYPAPSAAPGYPPASAPGSVAVQPGDASAGVSFEITPTTAEIYVDGTYAGRVAEHGPMSEPLGLAPGRHRIEVRAPGYQTLVFDAEVAAGQVTPYRGTMLPVRPY